MKANFPAHKSSRPKGPHPASAIHPPLDQFVSYFQPIVDLRNAKVVGLELLARWQHPAKGLLLPDVFIEHAEQEGWIGDLTCSLLAKSLISLELFPEPLCVSFNLSPLQLADRRLPALIAATSRLTGFPLHRLTVEITETALIQDQRCALEVAQELKAIGCKLSLDDFGTGYSSLLHLQSLPFDEIKVDRSFVGSMLERKESRKIVSAIVGLGHSLNIRTVAEGIEDPRQVEMLTWLGCDYGQGWLYGRPMEAKAFRAFLQAGQPLTSQQYDSSELSNFGLVTPAEQIAELRALYDGAPVGLAFIDTELRYRNLNDKMAEMNGAPVQHHLGRSVYEMIPAIYPKVRRFLQRALAGESIFDVEMSFQDPSSQSVRTRWLSYQPARDEAGEVIGVSVAAVDITDGRGRAADEYGEVLASAES